MSRPIAVVVSSYTVLTDQRSRASGNFSTKWFSSCSSMDIEVTVDGVANNDITFSMAIDKGGNDELKFSEVRNGSRLAYVSSNTFYICKVNTPANQKKNFTVTIKPA
ncbi:hypothetical protein D3P09_21075 [Paenibacillus pinisoli]|uniref:GOLD domain-containing protein n=1 Tax=Paenibacillus pinisoli TaxID=1276110 RepID=A0A3A6PM24_9BACL|nr:hypothetical protein [Paenibacillus pinisoli]RJX37481.1 hypothetical protein D3P09_21075 [Paenibacillus pinisoli]